MPPWQCQTPPPNSPLVQLSWRKLATKNIFFPVPTCRHVDFCGNLEDFNIRVCWDWLDLGAIKVHFLLGTSCSGFSAINVATWMWHGRNLRVYSVHCNVQTVPNPLTCREKKQDCLTILLNQWRLGAEWRLTATVNSLRPGIEDMTQSPQTKWDIDFSLFVGSLVVFFPFCLCRSHTAWAKMRN